VSAGPVLGSLLRQVAWRVKGARERTLTHQENTNDHRREPCPACGLMWGLPLIMVGNASFGGRSLSPKPDLSVSSLEENEKDQPGKGESTEVESNR